MAELTCHEYSSGIGSVWVNQKRNLERLFGGYDFEKGPMGGQRSNI